MNQLSSDGPMLLLEITKVIAHCPRNSTMTYMLSFGDMILAVGPYHAFVMPGGATVSAPALKQGDKIWIDAHAFLADGSLRNKK